MTTTRTRPSAAAQPRPSVRWWRRPWIAPLALVTVIFLALAVPPYLTLDPELSRFPVREDLAWHYPLLVVHIIAGSVVMIAMCLQVWPWLRHHHPHIHRWSGRLYVAVGIPLVGVPGLILAPLGHTGFGGQVGNTLWALLFLGCTLAGYRMIRQRRVAEHREWMLRSFALLLAIATNRVWAALCVMVLLPQLDTTFGGDMDMLLMSAAPTSGWLSWVVNLLIVEWWLHRKRGPRRAARSAG